MGVYIQHLPQLREIHFKNRIDIRSFPKWGRVLQRELAKKTNLEKLSLFFDAGCVVDASSLYVIAYLMSEILPPASKIIFDTSDYNKQVKELLKKPPKEEIMIREERAQTSGAFTFILRTLGQFIENVANTGKELLQFFGYVVIKIYEIIRTHKQLPLVSFAHHLDQVGLKAIPIIALISFLIGMVLTYQGINQLTRFGAEIYAIDFLTIGVFREIGVLLTAVVVAGRSSSSFTAQIGTMTLNQELDAMRVMTLDPIVYLVLPRMAALLVSLPLLVFLSDIMALLGGMLTTSLVIDIHPVQFMSQLKQAFTPATFWVGMSKAPLFAILIGLVGCFRGMQVRESAESVGRMTTASVVEAIFLIIVCNALMSLVFSYLQV